MFDYQPRLAGPSLHLRPLGPADWAGLFAIGGDPGVWALHPQPDRYTEANFRAYFEDAIASGGALLAARLDDGAVMGCSRFSALYADAGEIEIGWTFLGRAFWGGAANAEMKRLMLTHAFRFVPRVIFRIGAQNLRSRRATEKLGAQLTDKRQEVAGARPFTNVYYALTQEAFAKTTSG